MKSEKIIRYVIAPILLVVMVLLVLLALDAFSVGVESAEAATVLKRGSSGALVKTLQTKLKNWGYYSGKVDGIFSANTESAVLTSSSRMIKNCSGFFRVTEITPSSKEVSKFLEEGITE